MASIWRSASGAPGSSRRLASATRSKASAIAFGVLKSSARASLKPSRRVAT